MASDVIFKKSIDTDLYKILLSELERYGFDELFNDEELVERWYPETSGQWFHDQMEISDRLCPSEVSTVTDIL